MQLLDNQKLRIVREYEKEIARLEDALEETSEIISAVTNYAGIVSFLDWHDRLLYRGISHVLEQPEFRDYQKVRILVKMIEEKEKLLKVINKDFEGKVKVYIGKELDYPEMENCSLVVTNYRVKNKPSGKLAVLGPVRMEYNLAIPALEYISDCLTHILDEF
jgi:heat-inducible transcriptional repressor